MRNEGVGGIVEVIALLAVDTGNVPTPLPPGAAPVALLLPLAGAGTIAESAGAGRPT